MVEREINGGFNKFGREIEGEWRVSFKETAEVLTKTKEWFKQGGKKLSKRSALFEINQRLNSLKRSKRRNKKTGESERAVPEVEGVMVRVNNAGVYLYSKAEIKEVFEYLGSEEEDISYSVKRWFKNLGLGKEEFNQALEILFSE